MARRIGVDESGKGDYFGPLVIAACYVDDDLHIAELEGVQDSKKMTDALCLKLAPVIKAECPHSIVVVMPPKYNELYDKIKNLNRLLAWGHAQAIENVFKVTQCEDVISDQFANPAALKGMLEKKELKVKLVSRVRAESDLAVAAASVLARAEFLTKLKKLGEQFDVQLPKGAGTQVDDAGRSYIRKYGKERLIDVAKVHFKTTQKIS